MNDIEGLEGEEFVMTVELGKVREMARATGLSDYVDVVAAGDSSPPTFLTTQRNWQTGSADTWRLAGLHERLMLHAEQEYVFHGPPPPVGARLRCRSQITKEWHKDANSGKRLHFVEMTTWFRGADGSLIAEARMTGVEVLSDGGGGPR